MTQASYEVVGDLARRLAVASPPVKETGGIRADAAMARFREGMTDEDGLRDELRSLGWPEERLAVLVVAARLNYRYDRTGDLIRAYSDAYVRGQIDEALFRANLTTLGIVPQRIDDLVLRGNVRRTPTLGPTAAIGELAYFKTEPGRARLAAMKFAVREDIMTLAEFRAILPDLGIPPDLADALADYEEIRAIPEA